MFFITVLFIFYKFTNLEERRAMPTQLVYTKYRSASSIEQVEFHLEQKIREIRSIFLTKLNYHVLEIEQLHDPKPILDKFLKKVNYDLDQKIEDAEEKLLELENSTRARIEHYPGLMQFREDFEEVKKTEFPGAAVYSLWKSVEEETNEFKKVMNQGNLVENEVCMKTKFLEKFGDISMCDDKNFQGRIKFFVNKAGYGIIETDNKYNKQDFYFNVKNSSSSNFKSGQKVIFNSFKVKNPKYYNKEAINVKILN